MELDQKNWIKAGIVGLTYTIGNAAVVGPAVRQFATWNWGVIGIADILLVGAAYIVGSFITEQFVK